MSQEPTKTHVFFFDERVDGFFKMGKLWGAGTEWAEARWWKHNANNRTSLSPSPLNRWPLNLRNTKWRIWDRLTPLFEACNYQWTIKQISEFCIGDGQQNFKQTRFFLVCNLSWLAWLLRPLMVALSGGEVLACLHSVVSYILLCTHCGNLKGCAWKIGPTWTLRVCCWCAQLLLLWQLPLW